ncbi:MAG: response regulator transcription factor [Clostridiales bacterium]|nr:response regulator transcription factor [Clostridiales bacterium]
MATIAIVDDEKDLLTLLERYLAEEGYAVKTFESGEQALEAIGDAVDLWLLDIMLSGQISGFDLIRMIREKAPAPVIFMSARSQQLDRIMGLELGSDDYIPKPFSPRELVLRVRNVLRRTASPPQEGMRVGPYTVNAAGRTVFCEGAAVDLTSREMDLLLLLAGHRNQAFTRDQLLTGVWGPDYFGSDRVVDDLIKRLRRKMPALDIETIYAYGYRMK